MLPQQDIQKVRAASRLMVRELGFLTQQNICQNITHSECHVLIELEKHGSLTLLKLAEILRLDKSTVSRTIQSMRRKGLIQISKSTSQDGRLKPFTLTRMGKQQTEFVHRLSNNQVERALLELSSEERETVVRGLEAYARGLGASRRKAGLEIRKIQKSDDSEIEEIIRQVMTEHGASGAGFAIHDPEVRHMTKSYSKKGSSYFVITDGKRILGGGGIGLLDGTDGSVCELRKMYFLPELRGLGMGKRLLELCLSEAKRLGYKKCYLETLKSMQIARNLYEKMGFEKRCAPLGNTGHFGCDSWYERVL
jgi:putative acetyltransferase